jgi:hypothetical protein
MMVIMMMMMGINGGFSTKHFIYLILATILRVVSPNYSEKSRFR